MSIDWSDDLLTGVDTVDNQHRDIFGKLSDLLYAMSKGKGRQEIDKILAFLTDYVSDHFKEEETLMEKYHYNKEAASRMKTDHNRLLDNLSNLKKRYLEQGATLHLVVEVQQKLCDWLVNHISVEDKKLGAFLKTKGV